MFANDRLKFRAWCYSAQQVLEWSEIKEYFCALDWSEVLSDLSLMQSTSKFDSNGVEIYEGDIIADKDAPEIGYFVVLWSPETLSFMLGNLKHDPRDENYFKFEHPFDYLKDNIMPYDIVVGNVFENEELLTC